MKQTSCFRRHIFFKVTSPHIDVRHEYTVYDFCGILGTVGGSFGLFVGYSFYECLFGTEGRPETAFSERPKTERKDGGVWQRL